MPGTMLFSAMPVKIGWMAGRVTTRFMAAPEGTHSYFSPDSGMT